MKGLEKQKPSRFTFFRRGTQQWAMNPFGRPLKHFNMRSIWPAG